MKKIFLLSVLTVVLIPQAQAGIFGDSDGEKCQKQYVNDPKNSITQLVCEKAAQSGDAASMAILGEMLLAKDDITQAVRYFEQAAEQNDTKAMLHLGELHQNKKITNATPKLAKFYFEKACQLKSNKACEKVFLLNEQVEQQQAKQQEEINRLQQEKIELEREQAKKIREEEAKRQALAKEQAEKIRQLEAEKQRLVQQNNQTTQISTNTQTYTNYTNNAELPSLDPNQLKFRDGLAKAEYNGKWGYVNENGDWVIRPRFDYAGNFYHERAAFKIEQNGSQYWGFINKQGEMVVKPQFCMVGRFSEKLAGVYHGGYFDGTGCVGGKWGFIDINGNWVIPPILDEANAFSRGKAKVNYQGHTGFIDRTGKWIE